MSGLQVVQVVIDDSSDKTITGVYEFDRACGGVLIPPSGVSLPISSSAGEVFFDTSDSVLYRRDDTNITWIALTQVSSSLTPTSHAALRQLVHLGDDGPYEQFTSGSVKDVGPFPFPTSSVWFTDATRTKKIVETQIGYNMNKTPSVIVQRVYDLDGVTVLATATDTISYAGVFETGRTRTIT